MKRSVVDEHKLGAGGLLQLLQDRQPSFRIAAVDEMINKIEGFIGAEGLQQSLTAAGVDSVPEHEVHRRDADDRERGYARNPP